MADSLEAIIGAIYFDEEDLGVTRRFVRKILDELLHILLTQDVRGSVTPLQEINQKRYPVGLITRCSRPRCMLTTRRSPRRRGGSKREAKRKAAKKALFLITN